VARYLIAHRLDFVFATVGVGMADGGHTAASMYHRAIAHARAPDDLQVLPRLPLAVARLCVTLRAPLDPQLQGWLGLGAWVCGAPAWNHERDCAEIPLLLPLSRLRSPRARQFLASAA
jgi:putative hemolysin